MRKPFILLIIIVFTLISATARSERPIIITPQNAEELKAKISSASVPPVWVVTHSDWVDWKSVQPENYDKIYARISDDFFLSQFSLKRGFRLEPFFPLLFPKTPAEIQSASPEISQKVVQIQLEVNRTLHEIHTEFFLRPLVTWCLENHVILQYKICTTPNFPAAFLIEDALTVRNICTETEGDLTTKLALSVARQTGRLDLGNTPLNYSKDETVLLVPDAVICSELENRTKNNDFLFEFQIPYATVRLEESGPIAGFGGASWNTIQLLRDRKKYSPETQSFLKRFEDFGGKISKNLD